MKPQDLYIVKEISEQFTYLSADYKLTTDPGLMLGRIVTLPWGIEPLTIAQFDGVTVDYTCCTSESINISNTGSVWAFTPEQLELVYAT